MSVIWKILTGLLLSLSLTFTALFQNQVEWILPAFFSWRHLYASWWFSWHMLSDMKNLPENLSWRRSLDLFQRFFLLASTLRLSFLYLNFIITDSFFFKRWQACKSFGFNSCPIKESTLQMFTSSSSSLIDGWTGFTSTDSRRWNWALVTAFLSNWITLSINSLYSSLQWLSQMKQLQISSKHHQIDLINQKVLMIYLRQGWVLQLVFPFKSFLIDFLFEPF